MAEETVYKVAKDWKKQAFIDRDEYEKQYRKSVEKPDKFWGKEGERIDWIKPYSVVKNTSFAYPDVSIKWFEDGTLNVSANCVDRHLKKRRHQVAIIWEPDDPAEAPRHITYGELHREVNVFANVLLSMGVTRGDRVTIYLPMIPEAAYAMLACARIGAIHSVVFGGFSPDSLAGRITDCKSKLVITADEGLRGGRKIKLKHNTDEALTKSLGDEKVVVIKRTGGQCAMHAGRDFWYDDLAAKVSDDCPPAEMDAEDPLFILYTSGSTGQPKGVVHTSGGYLVYAAMTHQYVFDYHDGDVYWCTADVGWVTGHSYIVYGPLANGATQVMYEGTPDTPHQGRFWEIVQKYGVTILYTAPTAIRTFMKWGDDLPAKFDLSSLRVLGSVGEPINPEAWIWYRKHIGADRTPIVDTWWQTETGAMMISPLPGVTATKPGSAQTPLPGISATVVDDEANEVPNGGGGYLVLTEPWPSMLRTIWGDDQRFLDTYWSRFEGKYFAGDGAKKDDDGDIWLLGRVDDVMLVSGHNISTTEVESALVSHPSVAEAAVVGAADETTGQAIVAFVILRGTANAEDEGLVADLRNHVGATLGPIAKPKRILPVAELPKTRSGKIMRRLLRDVAENRQLGDVTTLTDSTVMDLIQAKLPAAPSED